MASSLATFVLGSRDPITAALTDVVITSGESASGVAQAFWGGFEGINALTVEVDFRYVSGGTTAILRVDTAQGADGGWRNVMRFDFATTLLVREMTIIRTAVLSPVTLADLGSEQAINYMGDRFRARLTTTGTYGGGTFINVRATPSK